MLMFALDDISIHALGCSNGCILVQAQVIRRGQQLKAKLDWDIHVGDIFAIAVAIPVVKVFDNLIEDHGAVDIFYHQRLALKVWNVPAEAEHNQTWRVCGQVKCSEYSCSPTEKSRMFSQQSIVNYHQSTKQAIWTRQRVGNIDLPHLLENTASLFGLSKLTSHVEHAFDDGADHSGITKNNKFKAIGRNESDVFACHCF